MWATSPSPVSSAITATNKEVKALERKLRMNYILFCESQLLKVQRTFHNILNLIPCLTHKGGQV